MAATYARLAPAHNAQRWIRHSPGAGRGKDPDCAYGAELHFLALRKLPVGKSVFPDVEFAAVAEAFGFQAYTIRSLDDLRALGAVLGKPDGPILLDCKVNADIAAPFMGEFAEFEARQHA